MDEIRLGTIGSGMIVQSLLDNVSVTEGIRLEAVYSRTRERGEALMRRYGGKKTYVDMDAFLRDPDVNTVYVASPNSLHYEYARRALLAGKNVICEKPCCPRASQVWELIDLAEERGLLLVDATPTAFLPNLEILKRELENIGKIKLVMCNYSQYSSRYDQVLAGNVPNVFNPEYAGGCLMDINYYNVYLNVALFGKPERAVYEANIYPGLVDTSGMVTMRYPGFVSQCVGAKDTWGVNYFQVEGEKGYIYVENGSNGLQQIKVVTKAGERVLNDQPNPDRWFYEVQNVTRLLLAGDREAIRRRLDVTLDVIGIIESVRKAAGIRFPGDN